MSHHSTFLIALGGNLPSNTGNPAENMRHALAALVAAGIKLQKTSRFYTTPCFPAGPGPDYVNAAALLHADLTAVDMLHLLHRIEAEMGRERVQRWGRRTLDLDLLAVGSLVLPDAQTQAQWRNLPPDQQASCTPEQLILPHPRLQDRAFVLVPLMDIAPDWVHPVLHQSVAQMCAALPMSDRAAVMAQ